MNTWIINLAAVLIAFVGMEAVAWLAHKYLMHGLFWNLHKDHHHPSGHGTLEKNDSFFFIFATPAIICFLIGIENFSVPFWVGLGITLYGLAYFLIHDIFIHQRAKLLRNANSGYFRAIRKAHKVHHKHMTKEEGECFGMLLPPLKYFRETKRNAS